MGLKYLPVLQNLCDVQALSKKFFIQWYKTISLRLRLLALYIDLIVLLLVKLLKNVLKFYHTMTPDTFV